MYFGKWSANVAGHTQKFGFFVSFKNNTLLLKIIKAKESSVLIYHCFLPKLGFISFIQRFSSIETNDIGSGLTLNAVVQTQMMSNVPIVQKTTKNSIKSF